MSTKKEQKIVLLTELNESDNVLILHGIKMATIFKKELCLFYSVTGKEKFKIDQIKEKLSGYIEILRKEIPQITVTTLILKGKLKQNIQPLIDRYEAILLLSSIKQYKQRIKILPLTQIPLLFVNTKTQKANLEYKKAIIPIDLRKENKDLALWGSYLGRFNNSEILTLAANDKNKSNKKQVLINIHSIKKLLHKLNITHSIFRGKKNSFGIQYEALDIAKKQNLDLLIILGSTTITLADKLIGLPEKKILKKAGNIPVMIINPQRDMYIMCD